MNKREKMSTKKLFHPINVKRTRKVNLNYNRKQYPFECNACDKRFRKRKYLNEHIKVMSRLTTYSCDHCQKCFFRRCHIIRHINGQCSARKLQITSWNELEYGYDSSGDINSCTIVNELAGGELLELDTNANIEKSTIEANATNNTKESERTNETGIL